MNIRALVCAFSLLAATSSTAFATPVAYTSQATWLAAVAGVTTETFASSPLGALPAGTTDIGQFSITIDTQNAGTNISDGGFINGTREFRGFLQNGGTTALSFGNFDAGPTIFGFGGSWLSTNTADSLTVTINGVTFRFLDYLGSPGDGFLAFADPAGFSSLSFGRVSPTVAGEFFQLDNAQIATSAAVAAVPEPSTLLLLGTGLAAAGVRRYRRKQ